MPAEIVFGQVLESLEAAGQKPSTERAVSNEQNSQIAAGLKDFVFRVPAPERVFSLKSRDRVDCVGALDSGRSGFGQAEAADLTFIDKARHCADRFFDRRTGVYAMLVVEIDCIYPEPAQAGLAS